MTDTASACPDEDSLVALVEHALEPAEVTAIEAHVATCDACADVLGNLGALAHTPPRMVDRYRLDRCLGTGGMGEVWAAFDPQLRRDVAIKLVRTDRSGATETQRDRERDRLLREARALARVKHPNVVAVHDVGTHEGEVFIVSELVIGDTLNQHRGPTTDWREVTALYAQAARGIAAAHAAGLVHRDVKPANLLVGTDGRVRVVDFGLAVPASAPIVADAETPDAKVTALLVSAALRSITERGHIAGTPAYMAPEQRAGRETGAPADQYALAVALVEAISGARPTIDPARPRVLDRDTILEHLRARRSVEPALEELVTQLARALSYAPMSRFPSMSDLADALDAFAPGSDDAIPSAMPSTRSTKHARSMRLPLPPLEPEPLPPLSVTKVTLAITVLVLLIVGLVLALR